MKHIATMKYIDVMKRVVTIKYQKWLVSALTLLLTWFGVPEMYSSRYFRAGDKIYIDVRQDKWDGGFDWSNDGANILMHLWGSGVNEWVHMNYKEYEHNDHKIRIYSGIIPTTGTYTGCNILRKASGHTEHDYTNIWNRTGDISVNDVYIYHYGNGESQTWGEWAHTLPDGRILAPYRSDLKNYAGLKADLASGGIAAEEYTICPSAAGDIISLHCKVNAGRTDYDETNVWQHAWYYSVDEGATWETLDGYAGCIRNDYEGNRTLFPTLPDPLPATICYYLHSHVASGCRLIKFTTDATGCEYDCTITSVERAISNVRAEDNTFTLDGLVAFGVADGDLKIVYAEGTPEEVVKTITTPISPQSFSIEGLPAATTSGVVRTLKAYFTGNPSCVKSFADVPVPDVRDAQITHETIHLLTGTSQTLTPTDYEVTNHAEWIDATEVAHNSAAGAAKTFTTMPSDTAGTHYYIYKEYYPMDCSNEDMMSNGDYEAASGYGTMGSVSDVSDYIFWGKYDNISTEIDFYDNEAINPKTGSPSRPTYESNGFAVIQHSKNFYGKYATIEAKHGTHFGLYDASSDGVAGKKAWYANTTTNPDLKLKKGMTYVFSFWAANINNYGEMDNAAVLQFQIEYNGNTELLGAPLDLGSAEFHNNIWHQCSSTFYASEDASEVTISVVNLNTDLLRVGNDFALDDIQFHAISTVAEVAKSYQQFRVDFHIPTLSAFTATPVQMGCGESSYSVDLHIEYKNQPGKLKVIDITDGGSSVVWDTALVALPGAGAGATWEEVKTIDRRVVQTIGSSDPVGKTRTYKVYFEDWTSANLTDDFNDPVIPVLTATHNNNPTAILPCDQLIYTLTVDVSYQNMSSDKIRVWVDGVSYDASSLKQEKTIVTGTSSIKSISFAIDNVPADSAEHMLHVECAGLGEGCFAPVTFRAPFSPKVVEPITVTTPTLNCGSAETYTATVNVTTTNHRNAILTAKLGSQTLSKAVTGDVTTFEFKGLPADGRTGNTVTAYFDYVHATLSTCEKTSAPFTAPILPSVDTAKVKYGALTCNDIYTTLTFDLKYANQPAGGLEIWVDEDVSHKITPTYEVGKTLRTLEKLKIENVPADSLNTHQLHVKFLGTNGCVVTYDLPRAPFMPHIESVNVSGLDAKSCGGSATYTATIAVNTTNQGNEAICVSLNGGTPQKKNPTGTSTTFTFTDLPANGSSNTIEAWFKCVEATCKFPEVAFTAPTLPKASVELPASMPTVAACDQPTFDLEFKLKYTYQDGELQVWVARAGDATKYGLKTFSASTSDDDDEYIKLDKEEHKKTITLTGLPSDGRSGYKLYYKFNEAGYCGYSSPIETALLTFPRSPTIDSVRVTGVPSKVADCTVDKYIAYVKVWYRYTSGEDLIIRYTDNAGVAHIQGPFTLVGNPHNQSVTLNDIGKGSKELYAYFFGSDCQTTPQHTGEYVAPSNSAINGDYKVRVKENKSTCGNLLYDLTGTITYEGDATANLVVKFDNKDSVIIAQSACSGSGTTFVIPNLTKAVKNKTLIAYFLDQPKCTAASDKFDSPDTCRYDVPTASISYSPAVCGETLTSLTFNLTYTYQSGTLKYWRDASDKKTATFKTNNDTTFTIEGLTLGGFPADSMTHKFYVQFEGGRCPDVKEFTTPEASFSPKVSNFKLKEITNELCNFDTYSAVVTFDVQNGQNKYIVAECKGKSAKRQIPSDGSYSLQIDGITRANPLNDFEVIRLYFPSADICSPNDTIRFKEKPKPALVKIEVDAAPDATTLCNATEYTLTGRLGYRNIKATPRVWLDDVSSDDKKTALDGYKSGFSTDEYIEFQLTVPADGKTHTVHADVTGWECAITPVDHDALWRPAVKDVKWNAPEFVYCDEPYDVKLEIEYERGVTGKNIYAWCTDHSAKIESSAALANGTGKATITLSNLTDRDNGWHNLTIYFEGMEASCPITSYKYNAPKTKTLTLGAPTANTVECGDPAFSITGSVTSNAGSGVVIVSDGTHKDEFDLSTRTTYTISGLTTGGSLTAQFKDHNCSKTKDEDAQPFPAVALKPIPTFSLKDITPQCYPAKEFAIGYEHTNAQTIVYTVNSGDEQNATVNASNEFTINTTGWADGEYTITASAVSADDCPSASSSIKKLIIRKQPKISIEQLDDACDDASSTALKVKTTAATSYNYYIVGETQLLATPVTVTSDGEHTTSLSISTLNVGDVAKSYTLKVVANSENCVSDTIEESFFIYPSPELAFEAIEPACYPASSVEVTYNPTNVKEFRYTVKTKDGSDTKISNLLVTVGATKQFTITTDGWAAGEYTLTAVATSTSEKGCTANATSVDFTILAKPTAEITKILNQCDNEGTTTVTYKAANATKFIYKIEGVMSDWSREEDVELDGSGTGTFSLSISALNVGETAKEYTVKFKTKSASCESDETSGKFTIYPLPTLTITNTTINTCYPTETTLVPYTSKNAATYTYTLSGNGISPRSETKSAEASGNIPVNTDGLAAGTYDLNVTAKSAATAGSCDIATVATGTITIQAQPTASIVDIDDQCDYVDDITVEFSAENASEFRYKIDGETNWASWTAIPASNKFPLDISDLNVGNTTKSYKLMLETKEGKCTSSLATKDFNILPIPTVTFNPSAIIIRADKENVDVELSFTNATTFDYSFVDEDNNVILDQKGTGVTISSNPLTLNLNTKDIGKGTYILKVTPHSTCEGTPNTLDVIVNDKPSIDFPGELEECEGTEDPMSVGYMASYDAKRLTYSIEKKVGDVYSTVVAEQTITLADYPSPFSIDVKNLVYGTYYISGYVVSLNPDESILEMGDLIRKEFTILAKPQENKVTQDVKFIGCGEEYSAKIVVNTFNAKGRNIIAEYSDNGGNHKLTEVAGAETATFDLSGLKDVGSTAGEKKTVTVSIDGVDCGITVEYEMPQLMTINPNFIVEPQPRTCDATIYTVKGTVVANCNEGKIVVEYNDTYKTEVNASTSGSDFTIADIPAGGSVTKLKAYFQGKTCGVVESAVFTEPTKPEASIAYTPIVAPACDVTTFDLSFTLSYTYQEAGSLTVWVDDDHKSTYTSAGGDYQPLNTSAQPLNGTITGLPADGCTGQKLYFEFDGTHSCSGSIDLPVFPQTPLITGVSVTNVPPYIEGLEGTYSPTITVTYQKAVGERIVLEYFNKNDQSQLAYSTTAVSGDSSYEFTGLSFDDVTMGSRTVHAYFEDSDCKTGGNHDGTYTAPTNSSITFESLTLVNASTCESLRYNLTGKVSFVGAVVSDLVVEFDATHQYVIPQSQCVAGKALEFAINGVSESIPVEGKTLSAYFSLIPGNVAYSEPVYEPLVPSLDAEIVRVDTIFTCGSKSYTVFLNITSENQRGACFVYDSIAGGTLRRVAKHDGTYNGTDEFTIAMPQRVEEHYIIVRYPNTECVVRFAPISVNPYTKPQPEITLTPIERVCNTATELVLPFAITQGDIAEASLTLTDSKEQTIVSDAELTVNATKDTLTYTLPGQLSAGKHTVTVEVRDALGCVGTATLPIELALDGQIYSKWNDVLLVDNSQGLYSAYQWYENGQPLSGKTDQVLYLPDGMKGTYTCLLTTPEGKLFTCEYEFEDIPRSADQQFSDNDITVLPNRVKAGGVVAVQQSQSETLRLILMSATGQRIGEYTQTDSKQLICMPAVQGVYLLRITSDSGMQTAKIVVY